MNEIHRTLIRKLREHSRLHREDIEEIETFSHATRSLSADEDFIRQGDEPKVAALVLSGIVARYHTLANGKRQYLSFHMSGDLPDAQGLFVSKMDHSVCAIGGALVATIPHREITRAFDRRANLGFCIWRETLIDAAIFREAITNNSARSATTRMAHFFCEIFYRAKASRLTEGNAFIFPISLVQLGETLGMAIATVNRALQDLRETQSMDFRLSKLSINNWSHLIEAGEFNPTYLHLKKPPEEPVS